MRAVVAREREKRCALIQAMVTPTVAAWVTVRAEEEGRSVSDFLRRLVECAMRSSRTEERESLDRDDALEISGRETHDTYR